MSTLHHVADQDGNSPFGGVPLTTLIIHKSGWVLALVSIGVGVHWGQSTNDAGVREGPRNDR